MTVLKFPQPTKIDYTDKLREALFVLIGDIEAFENSGTVKLNGIERHNLDRAKRLIGDWRPREFRE